MRKEKILIFTLVFISGLSVMAVEMAASRILVPFFGNSLFVWANIIGVVMVALAVGYFLGGRIADRYPYYRLLMYIVLLSGLFTASVPLFYRPVIIFILKLFGYSQLALSSFFSTLILFIIPIILLGFVSPFSIRLLSKEVEKSGNISGTIYSLGTVGSILGTFLASFVLIPFWGSRETILFASFLLILISVVCLAAKRKYLFVVLLLVPIIIYLSVSGHLKERSNLVYEKESPYQLIQIFEKDNSLLLSYNEGFGVQSVYNPESVMTDTYYDFFSLMPYFQETTEKKEVLIIGHGGGTSSRQYLHLFKDKFSLNIDAVEIDKEVTEAAKIYFDLDSQKINIYNTDGRSFLGFKEKKYDIIIIDAFNNRYNIPFHLTTKEFFEELKAHLGESGIIIVNFVVNEELKNYFAGTLKSIFSHVYFSAIAPDSWNELIIISDDPLNIKEFMARIDIAELKPAAEDLLEYIYEVKDYDAGKILTDNKAPIEIISPHI